MKAMIILMALTSSVFANTFTLENTGHVSWTVSANKKMEGSVKAFRNGITAKMENLDLKQRQVISNELFSFRNLNTVIDEEVKFDFKDERTQDNVADLMTNEFYQEVLAKLNEPKVLSEETFLSNMECTKKGLFKKTLNCQARFLNVIEIDLSQTAYGK